MKQNKWIVTSLLLLAGCLLPDRAAAQWKVGVSAGYAYNQYSIDTQYAYDFNFDGRGGVTVGIPVEYGILDWLAVRADFVYLQKGYSMQRAYDQGFRDRRDHYLSLPVMARFSFGGEKLRGFLHAGGYMGYWRGRVLPYPPPYRAGSGRPLLLCADLHDQGLYETYQTTAIQHHLHNTGWGKVLFLTNIFFNHSNSHSQ